MIKFEAVIHMAEGLRAQRRLMRLVIGYTEEEILILVCIQIF